MSSNTIDFIQLRWQQIRQFEYLQRLEKENIQLREELKQSKEKEHIVTYRYDSLKTALGKVMKDIKQCQFEMKELKTMTSTEIEESIRLLVSKTIDFKQEKVAYTAYLGQMDASKGEMESLRKGLIEAQTSLFNLNKTRNEDIEKYKGKISKLKTELVENEKAMESNRHDLSFQKTRLEYELKGKIELETKLESLTTEWKQLKNILLKTETEAQQSTFLLKEEMRQLSHSYEKRLFELNEENSHLRSTIDELQNQLDRILNEMMGKKSHFARFVELKTENINLQSKLSNITKKLSKSAGISTSARGDESSERPINNLPSPMASLISPVNVPNVSQRIMMRRTGQEVVSNDNHNSNSSSNSSSTTNITLSKSNQNTNLILSPSSVSSPSPLLLQKMDPGPKSSPQKSTRIHFDNSTSNFRFDQFDKGKDMNMNDSFEFDETILGPKDTKITNQNSLSKQQQKQKQQQQPIQVGVPLLNRQTRDTLKEREKTSVIV